MPLIDMDSLWQCETCFHHKANGCNTWCDTGEAYRPSARKLKVIDAESLRPKWISVEDRLPEDWCPVLVAMDDVAQPRVGCYEKIHAMWWRDSGGVPIRRTVTHWMPLPEPPNCGADMRKDDQYER